MNNDRILQFLGLCKRAGRLVSGADTVGKTVREGRARLVLYAADVSDNSLKKVIAAAEEHEIPVHRLTCGKDELGFALGKHCGIICVTDSGFAEKILRMLCDN